MNSRSVDLIYLDPPFNKNRDFFAPIGSEAAGASFEDAWKMSDITAELIDNVRASDKPLWSVIHSAGLVHSAAMKAYLYFMAVRILEMERILKPTGAIWLHCDSTASHYLKLVMDRVFGEKRFRNEIIWKRQSAHSDSQGFGRIADSLLFYGAPIIKDQVRVPLSPERTSAYRYRDERGRYDAGDMSAKGLMGGGYVYDFHGHPGPWRFPEARAKELDGDRRVHVPEAGGVPRIKRYLKDHRGVVPGSIWTDIPPVQSQSSERTGYPTQKPRKLVERVLLASSREGDMVCDPFAGCATTLVVAEILGRQWIGIDIETQARNLVASRLRGAADRALLKHNELPEVIHRKDLLHRTDLGPVPRYNSPANRERLYTEQNSRCNGCLGRFDARNLTVDHVTPRSKGGSDRIENLQLLCGYCNSTKGRGTQGALKARLREQGFLLSEAERQAIAYADSRTTPPGGAGTQTGS